MIEEIKRYYSNGQLLNHYYVKDGQLHGEYKSYYGDGRLYHYKIFVDDKELCINLSNEDKLDISPLIYYN